MQVLEILGQVNIEFLAATALAFLFGLLIGYIFAKAIKKLIVISIIIFLLVYFGVISLNVGKIQEIMANMKSLILGILAPFIPSGAFIVGVIIGFIIGIL